jgi:hypothetical protein
MERRYLKRFVRAALGALFLAGLQGCGLLWRSSNDDPPTRYEAAHLTVEVENRNFADANIYAIDGGLRVRLGRVSGKTTQTFTLEWHRFQIQMYIDFTGGGRTLSEIQGVSPGRVENLRLVIDVDMTRLATLRGRPVSLEVRHSNATTH